VDIVGIRETIYDLLLIFWILGQLIETGLDKLPGRILSSNEKKNNLLNDFVIIGLVIKIQICFNKRSHFLSSIMFFFLALQEPMPNLFEVEKSLFDSLLRECQKCALSG
jgi:hypothetical protein